MFLHAKSDLDQLYFFTTQLPKQAVTDISLTPRASFGNVLPRARFPSFLGHKTCCQNCVVGQLFYDEFFGASIFVIFLTLHLFLKLSYFGKLLPGDPRQWGN